MKDAAPKDHSFTEVVMLDKKVNRCIQIAQEVEIPTTEEELAQNPTIEESLLQTNGQVDRSEPVYEQVLTSSPPQQTQSEELRKIPQIFVDESGRVVVSVQMDPSSPISHDLTTEK